MEEGVIQFQLEHEYAPIGAFPLNDLKHWFKQCRALGLIGVDPTRYGGVAFGNLSLRAEGGFLITGTQTGAMTELKEEHVSLVLAVEQARGRVRSRGLRRPSSESMTHATLYQMNRVGGVIHVHSPQLWSLELPSTPQTVGYGTPEMAESVAQLLCSKEVYKGGVIRMGGHQDGLLFFGEDLDVAGAKLLTCCGSL